MKALLYTAIIFICFWNVALKAGDLAQGNRFEFSGYLSFISYGENIYLQADIIGGINLLNCLNFSIGSNLGYRNYSLTTLDYASFSIGRALKNNEFRAGVIAGLYTLWFAGYQTTIPCAGGEIVYSYNIVPNLSIRIKEKICNFFEYRNNLLSTSTFIGFCYAFCSHKRIATKKE